MVAVNDYDNFHDGQVPRGKQRLVTHALSTLRQILATLLCLHRSSLRYTRLRVLPLVAQEYRNCLTGCGLDEPIPEATAMLLSAWKQSAAAGIR
jgi:hypothetical protein